MFRRHGRYHYNSFCLFSLCTCSTRLQLRRCHTQNFAGDPFPGYGNSQNGVGIRKNGHCHFFLPVLLCAVFNRERGTLPEVYTALLDWWTYYCQFLSLTLWPPWIHLNCIANETSDVWCRRREDQGGNTCIIHWELLYYCILLCIMYVYNYIVLQLAGGTVYVYA